MKIRNSKKSAFTLVEIMIVVAIIGLLAAIAIPNFVKARSTARRNTCINNLRLIDGAKQQWALETGAGATATPNDTSLVSYIGRPGATALPVCPSGGTYTIGSVATAPSCDATEGGPHLLPNNTAP